MKKQYRYAWLGLVAGFILTCFDLWFFQLMNLRVEVNGENAQWTLFFLFLVTYCTLGFVGGRLFERNRDLKASAEVIQAQLSALKESQSKALHLEKLASLGQMSAQIAHELRNPLSVINSASALIKEKQHELSTESLKACEFIELEVKRLDDLVVQLLDYSKPITPHITALDQKSIDNYCRSFIQANIEGWREIDLSIDLQALNGAQADFNLITQVLCELLSNAHDAVSDKINESFEAQVSLHASKSESGYLIEVTNTGSGIDEVIRQQLFEPFFSTKARGTGLGLANCQRYVEALGGSIQCINIESNAINSKTCFRIRLPIKHEPRFGSEDNSVVKESL